MRHRTTDGFVVRRTHVFTLSAILVLGLVAGIFMMRPGPLMPEPGVSKSLAADRKARVSALRYAVTFRVPASRASAVTGRITATFELSDASTPLAFDFAQPPERLVGASIGDRTFSPHVENGHVMVPASRLTVGTNVVTFDFVAGDEPLNRGDDFMYSLFVPARASLAFPCFDQPDLKARWQLTLQVPQDWSAVSNARASGRVATGGDTNLVFDETEPLPTYLFTFAAGRFAVETKTIDGRAFRMFHRETDRGRLERNRDAIFALHAKALDWLTEYTGIPYPFGKFDFVLIPSFQFGGMEHPGAIFYNANALFLDEAATQNQALARANVIAHETAHMWFGNLVTMKWFNDVWMKEVFANFFAARIVNPSFPAINHELRFLLQHYPAAYEIDRTAGANPIRQELANLRDAGTLYGPVIYQKAPIVMRQLEQLVGEAAFHDGIRAYLSTHRFGNAGWPDLVADIDARTLVDVQRWSQAWIGESGRPAVATELVVADGRIVRLDFRQHDPRGRGLVWPERLRIAIGWPDRTREIDVTLDDVTTNVAEATGLPAPDWVLPVGGGLGYGLFELDPATRDYLVHSIHRIADPLTRGAALVALWDVMLEGVVPPVVMQDALMTALGVETNELNLQQMLDYSSTLFWRFTPPANRANVASRLEPILRGGLARAATTSTRAAWFNALRSTAIGADTVSWLEQVWSRTQKVAGLPLSETDEADLALDLAMRGLPSSDAMLDAQLARFQNADRKARFAFIMPAASSNPVMRDGFFQSLRDRANRAREAWVVDAVRYLHHPLRAEASQRYVRPALELVHEIQQTGDIFFPRRWTDATLSGYQDERTAAEVATFIANLPVDYPMRLRWVLLASADPLQRAARLGRR
jgi:aminopeptidase N